MDSTQQKSKASYIHYVWEDDENETLCGLDASSKPWVDSGTLCQGCKEVDFFLTIFDGFNKTYSIQDALKTTFKVLSR